MTFFEYVHPFYDGNGRMGSFLLSSCIARKTDLLTGISLSEVINQNCKEYEEAFLQVSHPRIEEKSRYLLANC
ncbi:Fic family protein [Streptococcus sp. 45]|uniref:Fic family protein n=1 Tax=Streptococcus sp. 45 TaxID=1855326 RepID=UPI000B870F41